jgi:hypothetical protein
MAIFIRTKVSIYRERMAARERRKNVGHVKRKGWEKFREERVERERKGEREIEI